MNELDFTFAWEGASGRPWQHLNVASFRGTEATSELYRYEIVLVSREPSPDVDPDDLVGQRATLRIGTLTEPRFRVVHGVLVEAEEIGPVPHGMMYRVVLAPPLVRARHRKRCRIFLEKTTRQIIDAVLQGDPELTRDDGAVAEPDGGDDGSFQTAKELYAWRVSDPARLDNVTARSYCVQYNESDLDFVARLLEEEGIGYHFENGDGVCLLVLADKDSGRSKLDPFLPIGPEILGRTVTTMKLGARLRPKKVSLVDYNWVKPALDMAVATPALPSGSELIEHEYPGRYLDKPELGRPLAEVKLDRLGVEASYATGESSCRVLFAGSIFTLEHPLTRYDGEYLITKLEVRGEQHGALPPNLAAMPLLGVPYQVSMECARRGKNGATVESRFRPARMTPKPRVQGTQTAFVTAEPSAQSAEINVGGPPGGEIGCVRVKFHWDKEAPRHAKEPTSCWVRVSQGFAGVGEGGVWHPRVGVEAIVDFEEGDPDRPIIVGRVYNGQNRPPGGSPTVSTLKSMTSPGGGSHNELRFDDTAGSQQILLHTPKDWNNEVGNDRSEQVGKNSASNVGVDRNEMTGTNRSTMVGSNNAEVIGANESVTIGANQTATIGANQTATIGANQTATIGANQTLTVGADQTETIVGNRTVTISGNDKLDVTGTQEIKITGAQSTQHLATHRIEVASDQKIQVGGEQTIDVTGPQGLKSAAKQRFEAPAQEIEAYGVQALKSTSLAVDASSDVKITTTSLQATGSAVVQIEGSQIIIKGGQVIVESGEVSITGGKVSIKGSPIDMDGGGAVNVVAGLIKLN